MADSLAGGTWLDGQNDSSFCDEALDAVVLRSGFGV